MGSLDEIFNLFSRRRRRFILYYLNQVDRAVPVEEVAEQVNEWEWNSETGSTPDEREKTILTLEHTHLPKIADAAQVEYNRENDQVQITGMSAEMDVLLSVSEAIEQPSRSGGIVFDCDF